MMPIRRFSEQSWFPDLFNDFFSNDRLFRASTTAPSVNIVEEEKDYKIEVAAPGMTKDDFDVHLSEDNELVVGMEKKTEKNDKDSKNRKYQIIHNLMTAAVEVVTGKMMNETVWKGSMEEFVSNYKGFVNGAVSFS